MSRPFALRTEICAGRSIIVFFISPKFLFLLCVLEYCCTPFGWFVIITTWLLCSVAGGFLHLNIQLDFFFYIYNWVKVVSYVNVLFNQSFMFMAFSLCVFLNLILSLLCQIILKYVPWWWFNQGVRNVIAFKNLLIYIICVI